MTKPERLRRDEAPTQGGSEAPRSKSHRSLDGLDQRSDNLQLFFNVMVWVGFFILGWTIFAGILGGCMYIIHLAFGS